MTYSNTAYPIVTVDTTATGTNASVAFGLGVYKMTTSSRYFVVGEDWTNYDKGVVFLEDISGSRQYGGLIWSESNDKYLLCRLTSSVAPYNDTAVWDDVVGNGSIASYHDLHIGRLLLQDATEPSGQKGIYSDSNDDLYFWNGTNSVALAPLNTSATVSASGSATVLSVTVADSTMGFIKFDVMATDGASSQGGFSGTIHYKREAAGNVEIIHTILSGTGENNIDLEAMIDTTTQVVGLTGYAASATTTFDIYYTNETRSL